ncbi:unnamed protein product [Trichobilharzia szidati]|nr:unnamed protein product [Trichobilharzia szidati]
MFYWTYVGVNTSIEGAGGPRCVEYISSRRKFIESVFICIVFSYTAYWSRTRLNVGVPRQCKEPLKLRQIILVIHSFAFGVELGFKLATRTLIWILNPCHIITMLQILFLASSSPTLTTTLFRIHIYLMNGPLLALTFPILNTRFLPFERVIYFIQHFLIILIPACFLNQNSEFSVEPINDLSWMLFALSAQILYHFLILQPIALLTGVNLNNILCPAVSDPFPGPNYRMWAVFHQSVMVFVVGKIFTLFLLRVNGYEVPWSHCNSPKRDEKHFLNQFLQSSSSNISNGRVTSWQWTDMLRYYPYLFDNTAKTNKDLIIPDSKDFVNHHFDQTLSS